MSETRDEAALAWLLERAHKAAPLELPMLFSSAGERAGLGKVSVYLADIQQDWLVPLPQHDPPKPQVDTDTPLAIDATLAGWAYRTQTMQISSAQELTLWMPLIDGIERIGVLRVAGQQLSATQVAAARALASLIALIVETKNIFSDSIIRATRQRPMSMPAELIWAFLPPRTLGTSRVTSSAVLEPAYEIGGDAFDHSLINGTLHVTVVDAMGHDLASGLQAAVALASCRSTRRRGGGLAEIAEEADRALSRWLPGRMLTGVFAELDLGTGQLQWINAGHPPPLLIRSQHVVTRALERAAEPPLGLGPEYARAPSTVHYGQLEPGDRILIHTDGVTDARSTDGQPFGEQRLIDFVVRATAAGEPAPEALRRLIHAILEHPHGQLRDDATILLTEWHPTQGQTAHSPAQCETTTASGDDSDVTL